MNLVLDLLAAAAVACSFIAVGDLIRGRQSRTIFAANTSFLIGSTMAAAILFPLSLVLGKATLITLFGLACCAGGVWTFLLIRHLVGSILYPARRPKVPPFLSTVALIFIAICVFFFFWQNLMYSPSSDGLRIWSWRAALLFRQGALTNATWPAYGTDSRLLSYPALVPLVESFLGYLRGDSLLAHVKVVFCLFYASLGLSLYSAASRVAGKQPALVLTAAILMLPGIISGTNWVGFADMPMAAVVAEVCASALERRTGPIGFRDPLPWLIAGLLTVKNEGNILFIVAVGALALAYFSSRIGSLTAAWLPVWRPAVILLAGQLLRSGYSRWVAVDDTTYGPLDTVHLMRAAFLWADIPAASAQYLLDLRTWGLLWIAFVPSAILVAWRGTAIQKALTIGAVGALLAYTAIFYFTNWDFQYHLKTAYPRLLEQLAPAAAIVVLAAWTLLGPFPGGAKHARLEDARRPPAAAK
jgi:hypothetical protein